MKLYVPRPNEHQEMFESGDDYDDKKNTVPNASAVTTGNSYYTLNKGGQNGYKLHILKRSRLVATEKPNGNLVLFSGWKSYFSDDGLLNPHITAKSAWDNLKKKSHRKVPGAPQVKLTVTKHPDTTPIPDLPREDPLSGTVSLQDNEILVTVQNSKVPDIFAQLDSVNIRYRGVEPSKTKQKTKTERGRDRQGSKSKSVRKRSISDDMIESYPELAKVFDEEAHHTTTNLRSYIRKHLERQVTQRLFRELLALLGYETSLNDSGDSCCGLIAIKNERKIGVRSFIGETIDEIDIRLCKSKYSEGSITNLFVIIVDTNLTYQAQMLGWPPQIRVIELEEFFSLVEGAVLRISKVEPNC